MKKAEKIVAENNFRMELCRQDTTNRRKGFMPGSTASHAKMSDYTVRDYLMAKGVGTVEDVRCREGSKHDWELIVNGKKIVGETKVGTGALRYAKTEEELDFDLSKIYPDVHYFAYCVESKKLKAHPEQMETLFRVFTREQFLECLIACGRNGIKGSLRIHKQTTGTWQLEIVAWATKQTACRLGKYEDWVEANSIPTLKEFRKALRG